MDLDKLIEQARASLAALLEQRKEKTTKLAELRSSLEKDATSVTQEQVTSAIAERDALDPQIDEARERVVELEGEKARDDAAAALAERVAPEGAQPRRASVTVGDEPEVYRKGGDRSYFRDLWMANTYGRRDSQERLRRNDEMVRHAVAHDPKVADQMRAIGTADGAGGEFVPPIWLVNEFEALARDGRVAANRVQNRTLPEGTDSISLPIVTGGTSTAEQTTQGNALSETDMTTDSTTAAVATIGGVQTVNLQLVEQSPINIDDLVLQDLAEDYAQRIDVFVLSNNATNKKGILFASGTNGVTYTDASPTVTALWPKLVDAKRQVGTNRKKPAREVLMTPTRWAFFEAALDGNNRPFVSDSLASAVPLLGTDQGQEYDGLVGTLRGLSLPVFADGNIPENLGAGTNEDRIVVWRPSDFTLWEGSRKAEAFRATKAKEAQVVFRLYAYAAFMSERAASGASIISGTGLVQPTF